ncbi:MAG: hypothetical protein WDM96_13935 [Lacunisphaera sp.]
MLQGEDHGHLHAAGGGLGLLERRLEVPLAHGGERRLVEDRVRALLHVFPRHRAVQLDHELDRDGALLFRLAGRFRVLRLDPRVENGGAEVDGDVSRGQAQGESEEQGAPRQRRAPRHRAEE